MILRYYFAEKTKRLRHFAVRLIAPQIFESTPGYGLVPIRPMMRFVKQYMKNKSLIGAEIGVANGDNAKTMLEHLSIKHLYLIDAYQSYSQTHYDRRDYTSIHHYSRAEHIARSNLSEFSDKITFLKMESEKAHKFMPNGLDFVYIDANHDYEFVKNDVSMYYRKVRSGGVLGGP